MRAPPCARPCTANRAAPGREAGRLFACHGLHTIGPLQQVVAGVSGPSGGQSFFPSSRSFSPVMLGVTRSLCVDKVAERRAGARPHQIQSGDRWKSSTAKAWNEGPANVAPRFNTFAISWSRTALSDGDPRPKPSWAVSQRNDAAGTWVPLGNAAAMVTLATEAAG